MAKSMEERLGALERSEAVMNERLVKLTDATNENTKAIRELTNTLSYNKGIVAASMKFAGLITVFIGAAWAIFTWVTGMVHGGAK